MKIPDSPPPVDSLLADLTSDRIEAIFGMRPGPHPGGKYRHWDTLRHIPAPVGLSSMDWWLSIKMARRSLYVPVPLCDPEGRAFQYAPVAIMQQMLMQVDREASGHILATDRITDPRTRDAYLLKGLIEEAITSSQLEGASTTREVAKEMIRQQRTPRTHDERMIYNNFQALQFIRRMTQAALTPSMVLEFHRILTNETLQDPGAAGRLRRADEEICVMDEVGNILHMPPPARELEHRLQALCDFANAGTDGETFIHPVVRAILLHFWLAYDHPFVDGNGRTARALFYWSMASQGYWLCEFISISRLLRKAQGRYVRSFLYTETDDNDLTYFILSQLRVTLRAIQDLLTYLEQKQEELNRTRRLVSDSRILREDLNFRQLALMRHALDHPGFVYTIESHRNSNNISYATARSDLLGMAEMSLLDRRQGPKRLMLFLSPADLHQRIATVA